MFALIWPRLIHENKNVRNDEVLFCAEQLSIHKTIFLTSRQVVTRHLHIVLIRSSLSRPLLAISYSIHFGNAKVSLSYRQYNKTKKSYVHQIILELLRKSDKRLA